MQELILEGCVHRLKLLTRFYACLAQLNYLSLDCYSNFVSTLIGLASREHSEFFLYIVSNIIIHSGNYVQKPVIQIFLDLVSRPRDLDAKTVLQVFPSQQEDVLSVLVKAIKSLNENGWDRPLILSLLDPQAKPIDYAFPQDLSVSGKSVYFTPLVLDCLNLSTNLIDFIISQEHCIEIIHAFKDNLDMAAQKLEGFKKGDILINSILSEVLSLTSNENPPVMFSTLLIKLLKISDPIDMVESKLVESLAYILDRIEGMELSSLEKLEIFLSHFISNMSFCWNWTYFLERTLSHSQELFLKKILARLVRLAYNEMVKSELPEALHIYLIQEPEPVLRFSEIEESVDNTDSQLIIDRINSKASNQLMKALLASKEICNSGELLMMIFCESLFYQGAKSMQHITIYLERYMEILTGVSPNKIITSLFNVWHKSHQRIELLCEKLLGYKLITSEDLASFSLDRLGKGDFYGDLYTLEWKLLETAIYESKTNKFDIIELICRACASILSDIHYKKLLAFLRKFIYYVEEQQLVLLESILPEIMIKDLRKINKLLIRS